MTGFKNATSYAQTLCASSKKMRLIGQILLFLTIISCTRNNDKELTSDSNDTFDTLNTFALLNYLLTDTTEIGLVKDGYKVISDIDMLPPPMWTGEGSFKKHLSEVLMEKDTLHIIKQLKELKNFRTDELVKYGFTVVKVSEMRAMKMTGEMFWDKIYKDYGPGLLTVSRPVFNKDYTKAYIRFGYSCGQLCGGGEDMIIEKVNDRWTIIEYVSGWES
jgi:hypothetical protein